MYHGENYEFGDNNKYVVVKSLDPKDLIIRINTKCATIADDFNGIDFSLRDRIREVQLIEKMSLSYQHDVATQSIALIKIPKTVIGALIKSTYLFEFRFMTGDSQVGFKSQILKVV